MWHFAIDSFHTCLTAHDVRMYVGVRLLLQELISCSTACMGGHPICRQLYLTSLKFSCEIEIILAELWFYLDNMYVVKWGNLPVVSS